MKNKFYQTTNGLNSVCGEHKPILGGGVGEINFGKQYRQGNRIYDSNEIAMCLLSQPVGNAGGYSYLYLVDEWGYIIVEDFYKSRPPRLYEDYAPTLRSERIGLKVLMFKWVYHI